jgi:hypothetical protein
VQIGTLASRTTSYNTPAKHDRNAFIKISIKLATSEHMSIESQGYDTLLAEINEKTWKQKTEQFMKRTKSEFNRGLFLSLSLSLSLFFSLSVYHSALCLSC